MPIVISTTPKALVGVLLATGVTLILAGAAGLVYVGGPNLDAECDDHEIDASPHTSAAFDGKWDAFDSRVAGGQRSTVAFDESELTQRAQAFLVDEDIEEIKEVTICLFADGIAEGKGKVDVQVFPDISVKIRGRIVLSGNVPVFEIDDFDVGSTGFLVDAFGAKDEVEDGVNEALEELDLNNPPYRVDISEGIATVTGG